MEKTPFTLPDSYIDKFQKDESDVKSELWLIFHSSKLLVYSETFQPYPLSPNLIKNTFYIGLFKDHHVHVGEAFSEQPPQDALWLDLRKLYGKLEEDLLALVGRATQLSLWNETHQFCGRCGSKTADKSNERAKECLSCGLLAYPNISPAVIVLVEKEDEILLARSPHFAKGIFGLIAGFVTPGESLESCVRREILEEVGLQVKNIQYFGSQPWPFPNSLMIAFKCEWESGEITLDPLEIETANWYKKDQLPPLPPPLSIGRALIDSVLI